MRITHKYIWMFLSILLIYSCKPGDTKDKRKKEVQAEMQAQISSLKSAVYFKDKAIRSYLKEELETFYKNRKYKLAWMTSDKILPQSDSLIQAIMQAPTDGLETSNYELQEIQALQRELFSAEKSKQDTLSLRKLVQLDFKMTASYLTYASHLLSGRIDPAKLDTLWITYPRKKDLAVHLDEAIKKNRIYGSLQELSPVVDQYKQLKKQLALYRRIAKSGGWPAMKTVTTVNMGTANEPVHALWNRLGMSGDLDTTAASMPVFDNAMKEALKKFQQRYGINPDGKLNAETLARLNEPVERTIELIELNMERIRWAPDSIENTYIWVNVPEYTLKVFSKGKKEEEMRVIVGKDYASTPVFSDTLEYIVFSPDWTVPSTIAKNEILPILQHNPDYLMSNNMAVYETWKESDTLALDPLSTDWSQFTPETFTYRIVQKPGPENPLGQVKFMLPNDLSVYLHDTPNHTLFKREERNLSHGCVRLEKPVDLAMYLLNWNEEQVTEKINQPEPIKQKLPKKWPVQIVYRTAWVDEKGILNFRDDIYGHDKKQLNAITKKEDQLSKL
ncbi:L,D-transpeptidase family protein [Rhodocytophaga rosea]|uniref:L,D-transpeptidase family protein n=1 Tax=Rhodocytophaga rosea TaxID=2704465 RepID=A0A6C0GK97_9BACT|nr:L,D-transpeptidase family protein [Rhodocytophaga rosea]QHT68103.1 L,D-transpeptidase family protein [Rhodocytophaga rosea]